MKPDPFEHEPLENIFRALEAMGEEATETELKHSLRERGLDPDRTTAEVSASVAEFIKGQRLSWREVAKQKQAHFDGIAASIVSWACRKKEEIEEAFASVQKGSSGPDAQLKLQVAFRNLSDVPLQDKASFLDEVEILTRLKSCLQNQEPPP